MTTLHWQPRKWLEKKARKGARGYPVGTVAFYGPDASRATKVAVAIIPAPDAEPAMLQRWFAESGDIRSDEKTLEEVGNFLHDNGAHSVAMTDGIIGCPHEEGTDYPDGETCPDCPYWARRDRWSGLLNSAS